MRRYKGTTLDLQQTPEGRWLWRVRIPPWETVDGLKASACNPSGQARSRRKAIAAAEQAVSRQMAEDEAQVEKMTWHPLSGFTDSEQAVTKSVA